MGRACAQAPGAASAAAAPTEERISSRRFIPALSQVRANGCAALLRQRACRTSDAPAGCRCVEIGPSLHPVERKHSMKMQPLFIALALVAGASFAQAPNGSAKAPADAPTATAPSAA